MITDFCADLKNKRTPYLTLTGASRPPLPQGEDEGEGERRQIEVIAKLPIP